MYWFCLAFLLSGLVQTAAVQAAVQCAVPTGAQSPPQTAQESKPSAQEPKPSAPAQSVNVPALSVRVMDETGVAVAAARVILTPTAVESPRRSETDATGWCQFTGLAPGVYRLSAEKDGFYATQISEVRIEGRAESLELILHHHQELSETINVLDSPPAIEPTKTVSSERLGYREILNLPYPTNRDIRSALPFIPGVVADATGQIHIAGSETHQIYDSLDGFNITHPANGAFELRVSVDAIRAVEVQNSRYSAEYGKGSGGVLGLTTGMGDDRFRFSATNFIPTVEMRKGLNVSDWTPRATFSGPLRKQRAWFFNAADGEYHLNIVKELPEGEDRRRAWRWGNLSKAQINLRPTNILTVGFLVNRFGATYAGLSLFDPIETTRLQDQSAWLYTIKDQAYLGRGLLLETGFGHNRYRLEEEPLGSEPYLIRPQARSGNYFKSTEIEAARTQWFGNMTLPLLDLRGRHEVKFGLDFNWITLDQLFRRAPIQIFRASGTLAREITFSNRPAFGETNLEASGYVQDRWALSDRMLIEAGLRFDWDRVLRRESFSPRLAATCLLSSDGETKIAAGIGIFHDATNLDFITRHLNGERIDLFHGSDGQTQPESRVETSFMVAREELRVPRFINWSIGVDHRLPAAVYLRVEALQKRGSRGFAFLNRVVEADGQQRQLFELGNTRRDRYDAIQISARRGLREGYEVFVSYTRSSARSNAVLDFTFDDPLFSLQAGGPAAWDAPNRLLSWGWMPLFKGFDLAYALDWRDGFPFSVVNEEQELIGRPGSRRFPDFFTLNVHLERRFRFFGANWALRAGFNNITGRANPTAVDNNIDSPAFLTFGGQQHRVFTGRIRFLGRK